MHYRLVNGLHQIYDPDIRLFGCIHNLTVLILADINMIPFQDVDDLNLI